MGNLKTWINGVVGGFIAAAANGITLIIVDPAKFSPAADGGWKNLGVSILVSGGVGAALFLKTHPTPWDGTIDRRNGNAGRVAPLEDRRNAQVLGVPGVPQEPPAAVNPVVPPGKNQGNTPTNGGA